MVNPRAIIDTITATQRGDKDKAMKVRNALRMVLRAWEELHDLPYSFELRSESRPRTSGGHTIDREAA